MTIQDTGKSTVTAWRDWVIEDTDGEPISLQEYSCRLASASRRNHEVESKIAAALGETQAWPKRIINTLVRKLGPEVCLSLLEETMQIEESGGMMTSDGKKRRTPGGTFFKLAKEKGGPEIQDLDIWTPQWKRKPQGALVRPDGTLAPLPSAPAPAQAVAPQKTSTQNTSGGGKGTVSKITLIGRPQQPGDIAFRTGYTAVVLHSTKTPALPKGLPSPSSEPTDYVVLISAKQWSKVERCLDDPEDSLIIEGFPQVNRTNGSITVFASNVTSKVMQRQLREQQQQKAG